MSADSQWRWTDDEGVQRLLSGDELRKALRERRLKPSVLVWRRGMTHWLAAADVPELHAAGKRNTRKAWPKGAVRDRPEDTVTNIRAGDPRSTDTDVLAQELQPALRKPTGGSQPPPAPKRSQAPAAKTKQRGFLPSAAPAVRRAKPTSIPLPRRRAPDARPTRKRALSMENARIPAATAALVPSLVKTRTAPTVRSQTSSKPPLHAPQPAVRSTSVQVGATVRSNSSAAARSNPSAVLPAARSNPSAVLPAARSNPAALFDAMDAAIPKAPRLPNLSKTPDGISEVPQSHVPTVVPPTFAQRTGVTLPFPLLIGAAAALLLLLLLAFAGGRASATAQGGMADAIRARNGWVALPLYTRQQVTRGTPRSCLMARAPARIARPAYQRVPMELLAIGEARVAIGFAASANQASGVIYNLMSAEAKEVFTPEAGDEPLSRVVPLAKDDGVTFVTSLKRQGELRDAVMVPAKSPFSLAFKDNDLVYRANDKAAPKTVWSLGVSNKPADSIRATIIRDGVATSWRNGREIYAGEQDEDGGSRVTATKIWTTEGTLGRPSVGYNGNAIAVAFADLPKGAKGAKLMLAYASAGQALPQAHEVELPPGGPGVSAIAPAIAGLSGGRWLLMWTEGPRRARTLRAQTYDRNFRRVGEALRVSPATGSFGQGTVTVVQERVIVGFLLATGGTFELWSTVLQCQ